MDTKSQPPTASNPTPATNSASAAVAAAAAARMSTATSSPSSIGSLIVGNQSENKLAYTNHVFVAPGPFSAWMKTGNHSHTASSTERETESYWMMCVGGDELRFELC